MNNTSDANIDGFSLIELSIVLVILGLLTGGILGGQALIRAAELRAVPTEYSRWVSATQAFRDKYFTLPGDMPNATAFWGAEPIGNCTTSSTVASTTSATCNGNGNGEVADGGQVSVESWRFWQHLANAGLIEGTFSGANHVTTQGHINPGVNVPRSKVDNSAGWDIRAWGQQTVAGSAPSGGILFEGSYGHAFRLGAQLGGGQSAGASGPIFLPEDAWNIDTKMDDGRPAFGKVRTFESNGLICNGVAQNTGAALASTAAYNLQNTSRACAFVFPEAF